MRIGVLGPLVVDDDITPAPRDRVVLEVLVVHRGRPVDADALAEVLWGDSPPASWKKVLQGCVMRLRQTLGTTSIRTTSSGYQLECRGDHLDADRFERFARRARELLLVGEPEQAADTASTALMLWRGRPYADLDEWDEARIERVRLDEVRLDLEELATEAALQAGHHRTVLGVARAHADQQPLRERRWALLARAEYQSGRQSEALRTIGRARTVLRSEVGLDLGPELRELEQAILLQDPSLDVMMDDSTNSAVCPFLGLVHYDVDDAELFFGRESVVDACLDVLRVENVLAVVGPSGSGKSSVVRAGVAASLRAAGARVQIVSPALLSHDSLSAERLADVDVLVVDQCEEAVTRADDASTRQIFEDIASFAVDRQVVLALRADRLAEVSQHASIARLIERGLHLLRAMDEKELRHAIEGPARRAGLLLEAGLIDLLVREVEGEPGALPMLSHSLRGTWERREGRVLTAAGYRHTGGLRAAVARSAEELYATLTGDQRILVRELVLRMVTPTLDGDPVRTPIPRRLVAGDRRHEVVIEMLVDSRLVTSDGENVELAHEALVRAWPRLRTWLDDDVEGQRILRHLTVAADSWSEMGRPDSELYRGHRLRAALDWRDRNDPSLTPAEHTFLDAGSDVAEREAADIARNERRQARANRQLRALLASALVLMLTAAAAGVVAFRSAGRARQDASSVEAAGAQALATLSSNALDEDRSVALLLGIEANRIKDTPATRGAIVTALFDQPFRRTSIATPATDHMAVAVDAQGSLAVAKRADGLLDVVDLQTRRVRFAGLPGPPSPVGGIDVDRAGTMVVSSGVPTAIGTVVYDLERGEELVRFPNDDAFFRWARFSPDGQRLSVADGDGLVRMYDTNDWREAAVFDTGLNSPISATAFDSTGTRLYVASIDPSVSTGSARVLVLDAQTGDVIIGPVDAAEPLISSIALSADDSEVILAGAWIDRRTTDTLERVGERFGQSDVDGLVTLAVGSGATVAAGSPIELQVFDDVGAAQLASARVFDGGAPGVAFSGDGSVLITADIDGSISTWTVRPGDVVGDALQPPAHGQVTMSPDGATLIVWDDEHGVDLYDRLSLQRRAVLDVPAGQRIVGLDTDESSSRLVTLSCPPDPSRCVAVIDVWEIATGLRVGGPKTIGDVWPGLRRGVALTRGDTQVAAALGTGVVGFWDAETLDGVPGRPRLADHTAVGGGGTWAVASADVDGRSVLVAHDDLAQSVAWDVTGDEPRLIGSLENAFRMGFTPDGGLITSSGPGSLIVRDPLTLEPIGDVMPGQMPADTYQVAHTHIMVASGDHGVMLWDLNEAEAVTGRIPGSRSALAPDGSTLYVGSSENGSDVRAVSLLSPDLIREACDRAGRNLTTTEWRRAMGAGEPYRQTCTQWPANQR